MAIQTFAIDTSLYEFRYHGASEYKAYNRETEKRNTEQARDEDTGYPIYSVRCQVLFRELRESGIITIRVPLTEPPGDDVEFEAPVKFSGVTAKPWNMDGRDGQTWTAQTMGFVGNRQPATPPSTTSTAKSADSKAA